MPTDPKPPTAIDDPERRYFVSLLARLHSGREDREKALAELRSLDENGFLVLSGLLSHEDPDLRCDAAEALMRIAAQAALPLVAPLLKDRVAGVRWHVCGLLFQFGDSRATSNLASVITDDPDGNVRYFAVDALARIGDESALPALRMAQVRDEGTDREGRPIKDAAREAIEEIANRYMG